MDENDDDAASLDKPLRANQPARRSQMEYGMEIAWIRWIRLFVCGYARGC